MAKMGIENVRCLFYETTGKTTCPFHMILFKTYTNHDKIGVRLVKVMERFKPKRKTARRGYGKSR